MAWSLSPRCGKCRAGCCNASELPLPPKGGHLKKSKNNFENNFGSSLIISIAFNQGQYRMERQIGIWSLSSGLKIHEPNMFERRSNFGGISLTNIFLPYPPFLIENSSDVLDGVSVEIVKMLQMALNFSTVYMKPSDGLWGGRNDNGKEYVNIFSTRKKEKVFQ